MRVGAEPPFPATRAALSDTGTMETGNAMNLAEHVLRAGQATPDKLAMSVLGLSRADRWSHGRLRQAVLGGATGLRQAGLVPGDRLLLRLGNTPAFPIAYLAAIAAGIVPVPTSNICTMCGAFEARNAAIAATIVSG